MLINFLIELINIKTENKQEEFKVKNLTDELISMKKKFLEQSNMFQTLQESYLAQAKYLKQVQNKLRKVLQLFI